MLRLPYNDQHVPQLARELSVLGLPGFRGVAKLSRDVDSTGRVVLENGTPKRVPSYLLVKSDDLSPVQEASVRAEVERHIPSFDSRRDEIQSVFMGEAIKRIAVEVLDWDTLDTIKAVAGMWDSHLAATATAEQTTAMGIYLYIRNTVPSKLAAVTTQATFDAIDPMAADPFSDGTVWPK